MSAPKKKGCVPWTRQSKSSARGWSVRNPGCTPPLPGPPLLTSFERALSPFLSLSEKQTTRHRPLGKKTSEPASFSPILSLSRLSRGDSSSVGVLPVLSPCLLSAWVCNSIRHLSTVASLLSPACTLRCYPSLTRDDPRPAARPPSGVLGGGQVTSGCFGEAFFPMRGGLRRNK